MSDTAGGFKTQRRKPQCRQAQETRTATNDGFEEEPQVELIGSSAGSNISVSPFDEPRLRASLGLTGIAPADQHSQETNL